MGLTWIELIILVLASFRITRLLVYDTITEWLRRPFHKEIEQVNGEGETEIFIEAKGRGLQKFIGELLSCHWCTGVWVSALVYGTFLYLPVLIPLWIVFAISGGAAILFKFFD
ncbi:MULTISPECIES: DUF1360 domain-containing protein [Pontibacillus]|uniref:DUF1360 domain-containing protein n=1 Tax=Pontibacillus chungwhensis TaxID=265426 RepID=A0ABY8UZD7_9BACI|nr:DUF1360 domain-containing protein [Pontibacillus chungwhensis]MCD5324658.1 DUF1360 domain-containing protein [Pontibacillus sp. HN14]WIF99047.1 DUF1360 domain-containing protein [Pontibacillus chungwhensis]